MDKILEKVRGALQGFGLIAQPNGALLVIAPDGSRAEITVRSVPVGPVLSGLPQWEAERMIASGEVTRPVDAAVAAEAEGRAEWQLKAAEEKQKAEAAAQAVQAQQDIAAALASLKKQAEAAKKTADAAVAAAAAQAARQAQPDILTAALK